MSSHVKRVNLLVVGISFLVLRIFLLGIKGCTAESMKYKFYKFCFLQAYSSYMKGGVSFELQKWKEALELFGRARYNNCF